jgi:hypothetical protein
MKRSAAIETGRLALSDRDLLASDIAGEVSMSPIRGAAGEPTIRENPARFYRFDPVRRWHFDFAWPEKLIAVEVVPAAMIARPAALYRNELERYNSAALHGWRVFRFTPRDVKTGVAIELLRKAFDKPPIAGQNQTQGKNADDRIDAGTIAISPARPPLPVDQ